jgi:hypothetical protein
MAQRMVDPTSKNNENPIPESLVKNWTGPKSEAEGVKRKRTLRYTLLLGAIAGFTFSLALWGYETILFFQAHVAYPWLPMLVGTLLCTILCTTAATLTFFVNKALLGAVFWILAARLIAELAIRLPLRITPGLMMFFEPGLRSWLPVYPITDTLRTWAGFGTVWLGIFLGILGLLQITLVESAVPATTAAGRLTPYFVIIPVMVLASVMSSNVMNEQLRAPLIGTYNGIQFYVENQNVKVDPVIARQMHMSSFADISDLIKLPYRLFLGKYDEFYGQVEILIDFKQKWVSCTTVYGQPVFCKVISNP